MAYRKPRYFVGQQNPALTLRRRDLPSIDGYEVKEKGKSLTPSPLPVKYDSSPARVVNRTKPIWIDSKTGIVVDGPDILKGEKLIRIASSSSDSSSNTGDISSQIVPRRSRSPSKSKSLSPRHRIPATIQLTSRSKSHHHFVPLSSENDLSSTSPSSSGYSSSGYLRQRYPGAKQRPPRTSKIITMSLPDEQSPLRNLVPHHHSCGKRQTTCPHKRCRKICGYCNTNDRPQLVSRRSRAIPEKPPERMNSNLSFFGETILPGPNMPIKHFTPLRYDEFDLYSDSGDSYEVYSRIHKGNRPPVRAKKSTHSPSYLFKNRSYRNY